MALLLYRDCLRLRQSDFAQRGRQRQRLAKQKRQMQVTKKVSGLVVCAAIIGWLTISDLRQKTADLKSDVDDMGYVATQLEADLSELKNSVGDTTSGFGSFGSNQSDRIEEAERRAREAEYTATEALEQARQLEREVIRLQITRGY